MDQHNDDRSVQIVGAEGMAAALSTLGLAFASDPVMRWFWPNAQVYRDAFPRFAAAISGAAFEDGTALSCDDGHGLALWLKPGVELDDDVIVPIFLETMSPDLLEDLSSFAELIKGRHPADEHWYLPITGVDPFFQGKGLGSTLLQHAVELCDRDGLPAYLEASTVRSRLLYARFGFRDLGAIQVGSSPEVWPMLRDPGASH